MASVVCGMNADGLGTGTAALKHRAAAQWGFALVCCPEVASKGRF